MQKKKEASPENKTEYIIRLQRSGRKLWTFSHLDCVVKEPFGIVPSRQLPKETSWLCCAGDDG